MARVTSRKGFTLLEMLVAMTLMSMLAASLYASLHVAFRGRRAAERGMEPPARAAAALRMLREDIESATVPTGLLAGEFVGEDAQDERGREADVLTFHALARDQWAGDPPSPIVNVEIAVSADDETGEGTLVRRVTANLLAPEAQDPIEEVLCRRVSALDVTFFDGTDWLESWDSTTAGDVLPLAVRLTISLETEDEEEDYVVSRVFALPCGSLPEEEESTGRATGGGR